MDSTVVHPDDDVLVALRDINKGETVQHVHGELIVTEAIEKGHKAALRDIKQGERILKYGFPIGTATERIPKGAWSIHTTSRRRLMAR